MGMLDGARSAAQRAADATRRGAADARERAQDLAIRRRQDALVSELGRIVVRRHGGEAGLEAEEARLVAAIRAAQAEIDRS